MIYLIIGPTMSWISDIYVDSLKSEIEGAQVIKSLYKEFPDGESYVKIPLDSIKSQDEVILLHTLSYPQDRSFVQLLQLIDAVLNLGGEEITAFVPYLAYARQDKVFTSGEPVSIKVVLSSIFSAGARFLYTIDAHNPQSLLYFPGKAVNLMPLHLLVESLLGQSTDNAIVIAPDRGAEERAKIAAKVYNLPYGHLKKKRDRTTGEISIEISDIDVKGKTVILIDDIISTGGTISLAGKMMYERGARDVYVACSHALLVGDSYSKIKASGIRKIIAFNTLPPKDNVIYVDVIRWGLRQIIGNNSEFY